MTARPTDVEGRWRGYWSANMPPEVLPVANRPAMGCSFLSSTRESGSMVRPLTVTRTEEFVMTA